MKEMIEAVRKFTAGEIAPHAAEVDRSGQLPPDLFRKLGEQGIAGLVIPEKWGGIGADLASFAACLEVIAAGCASTAWVLLSHSASARTLVGAGSDAQKDHYLPQLAAGQMIGSAMAGTEAGGGSNPMGMRTRASHDGRGWVLEGGKEFITLAGAADLYVVMARTAEPPPALGCFLVEKADTGLAFGRREELLGVRGVPVGGFALAQCRLGGERLLGAETGGLAVMGAMGSWGLAGAAAAAAGVAATALDETSAYLRERVVAGAALASLPGVQSAMGELRSELAGAHARLAQAIRDVEGVPGPPLPLFMAKVSATESAVRIVDRCMALHGAAGYSREFAIERHARDVRAFTIHWGNNEVLRDTLAKASLS